MRSYLAALVALVACSGKIAEAPPFAPTSIECTTPPAAATTCALCGDGWHCPTGLLQQCPPGFGLPLSPQADPVQARTETSRVTIAGPCFSCVDGIGTEYSLVTTPAVSPSSPTTMKVAAVAQFPCAP